MLAEDENFAGLARLNRAPIGKAEAVDSGCRAILDMDSTEVPVYAEQEQTAYNGYLESTCYHPLLLFNREGDCLAASGATEGANLNLFRGPLMLRTFHTRRAVAYGAGQVYIMTRARVHSGKCG